jgi:crotonobetainyl-CoA:carnitine CoA-transferase CaiB-like acyl-CoA transferase
LAIAFATGVSPGPMGSAHPLNAPYQAFRTADGWVNLGAANQANWERMLTVIGAPELKADPRFASNRARMANREVLAETLDLYFAKRTTAEWIAALEAVGVPAGPVLSIAEMHAHPQTAARGMVIETEHPVAGHVKAIGMPVKFGGTPCGSSRPAPLCGEHSREVLAEHGYTADEIGRLISGGAVVAAESL